MEVIMVTDFASHSHTCQEQYSQQIAQYACLYGEINILLHSYVSACGEPNVQKSGIQNR